MSLPELPSISQQITLQITYDPTRLGPPAGWDWAELLSLHGVHAISRISASRPAGAESDEPLTLTAANLAELMFPSSLQAPLSPDPRDNPIFRVRVVSYALGLALANLDPTREYFHFFFYPERRPEPQVEIWSALAWRHSLTRRLRQSAMARELDPNRDLNSRIDTLREHLILFIHKTTAVPYGRAREAAEGFIYFFSNFKAFLEVLNPPADLMAELTAVHAALGQTPNSNPNSTTQQ